MNVVPLFPRGCCAACKRAIRGGDPVVDSRLPSGDTASVHLACMAQGKTRAPETGPDAEVVAFPVRENSPGHSPEIA